MPKIQGIKHKQLDNKILIVGRTFALIGVVLIVFAIIGLACFDCDACAFLLILGITPYIIFLFGLSTKCPECGRWWAQRIINSDLLDLWQETEGVDREDVTTDYKGRVSRTKRLEAVTVHCEERRNYYI